METLENYLRRRRIMLVLDNCEHLIQACADLVGRLLRSCRELKVPATSREPLSIQGEVVWRVPSLSSPELDQVEGIEASDLKRFEAVPPDETLELLAQLVDKSMVQVAENEGERRYRLLETIRQYARDRLAQTAEAEALRSRHRDWYLGLAERAEPELHGHDQIAWMDRLELEMDNFRDAIGWCLETGNNDKVLRLAGALSLFWYVRGYYTEGRHLLERVLEVGKKASTAARLKALYGAGWMEFAAQDYDRMEQFGRQSLALAKESHDRKSEAFALILLADGAYNRGDNSLARTLLEKSCAQFRELGEKWVLGHSVRLLGHIVKRQSMAVYGRVGGRGPCDRTGRAGGTSLRGCGGRTGTRHLLCS